MNIILQHVLVAEDLTRVREELTTFAWRPGKLTAGPAARGVKENLQADAADPRTQALETFVLEALRRHPLFEIAARPDRISRLIFSRYEPGMNYGAHTDVALMGPLQDRLRTDLAFTIFLADRTTYEGGALAVESALGEQSFVLEAGDAILYPAGSIHRVVPVTRGARYAAVGWVQSFIADPTQREIMFDLAVVRARLGDTNAPAQEMLRLDKAMSNLLRMWSR